MKKTMESFLLKGLIIGILFGLPVGAVGAVTVQRTLLHGSWAGFVSGMGSSAADLFYACIGSFGLTFISDFLLDHQKIINLLGGTLILLMGINMIVKPNEAGISQSTAVSNTKMFLSSFAVGITNPAAVLTFLFAFSFFGITGQLDFVKGIQLVFGIFIGTLLWWGALVNGVSMMKNKTIKYSFKNSNKIFGSILLLLSAAVFISII
ncbi:LysE family translocator [Bacillus sp. AK031]